MLNVPSLRQRHVRCILQSQTQPSHEPHPLAGKQGYRGAPRRCVPQARHHRLAQAGGSPVCSGGHGGIQGCSQQEAYRSRAPRFRFPPRKARRLCGWLLLARLPRAFSQAEKPSGVLGCQDQRQSGPRCRHHSWPPQVRLARPPPLGARVGGQKRNTPRCTPSALLVVV